jgi:hypothetical protein
MHQQAARVEEMKKKTQRERERGRKHGKKHAGRRPVCPSFLREEHIVTCGQAGEHSRHRTGREVQSNQRLGQRQSPHLL